jgi:hypothetical protein
MYSIFIQPRFQHQTQDHKTKPQPKEMIIKDIRIKVFGYCSRNITGFGINRSEELKQKVGLSLQFSVIKMQGHD